MKTRTFDAKRGNVSLLDLLAILIVVAVMAMMGLAHLARTHARSARIGCINDLKHVGLAFRLWSGDNGDKYPMQISTNSGGTMELIRSGSVFPNFVVISNELGTPKVLACPQDTQCAPASSFTALTDSNVSYFVALDADQTVSNLWLSGDRNLTPDQSPPRPGLLTVTANSRMNWTAQIHTNQGNLCFADGSVQQLNNAGLDRSATNALAAYFAATTNTAFRLAIP